MQRRILAKAVVNSWIFVKLIQLAGTNGYVTNQDIEQIIASVNRTDGTGRYSGDTIFRRRRTIVSWIKWLAEEIGCFRVADDTYQIV
jgi:hypothetical protein